MLSRLRASRAGSERFDPESAAPVLSVVVPVYNVEHYLAACLDSLAAQTFTDVEVVIVDDGSTDGSATIAAAYAAEHDGWRLVATSNRGLGATRNRGIQEVRGEFVAFLDSDDLLPVHAYELLVSTLRESGSDFVVGSFEQLVDGQRIEPAWIRRLHQHRRIGVTLEQFPQILPNVFAWDKVFRRSFYERIGLSFPEGVRYEDQVAMTEAYLRADSFDVVRRPVYIWRIRDDGSSITQRRHELANLEDRLVTKQLTTDVVRRFGSPGVLDYWARHGLVGDLPVYFREIPAADEAYWQRLVTGVRELFVGLPAIHESALRVGMRLVGSLVAQDRRGDAETVLTWLDEHPGPLSLRVEGDHVVAGLPLCGDPDAALAPNVCWLGEHELDHDARLVDVRWDDANLLVTGWGLIRGAPTAGVETRIRVSVSSDVDGTRVAVDASVERFTAPEATAWVNRGNQVYDDAGFVAGIDVPGVLAVLASQGGGTPGPLVFDIDVQVAGIRRSGRFRSKQPGLDLAARSDGRHLAGVRFTAGDGLTLEPRPAS